MSEQLISKSGRPFRLRRAALQDIDSLLEAQRAVVSAGDGVVMTLVDLSDSAAFTERMRYSVARLTGHAGSWVVAEWLDAPGHILGNCGIWRMEPGLVRHVAQLSLEVHPAAQAQGIGRALIGAALDWVKGDGRAPPRISRVELYVRADNHRARRLYESLGFEVEGRRRDFVRLPDGQVVDDLLMARLYGE